MAPRPRFRSLRRTNRLAACAFLTLIALPGLLTLAGVRPVDFTAQHRPPAPGWPASAREWLSLPGALRYYFEKTFATRDLALEIYGTITARWMASSPNMSVELGRDDWLFLRGEGAMDGYRRFASFDEAALDAWEKALKAWDQAAIAAGGRFFFLVVPDKHSIYGDAIPARFLRRPGMSRLDQLERAMAERGGPQPIDCRAELRSAAQQDRVYHKTDTHWNEKGACVAWRRLMESIASAHFDAATGDTKDVFLELPIQWTWESHLGGDLSRMIGLKGRVRERIPVGRFSLEQLATWDNGDPLPRPEMDAPQILGERRATRCPGAPYPSAVVHIDSFGHVMIPLLAQSFERCVFVKSSVLDAELLNREHPEVVILELIERRLMTMTPTDHAR